jgi:deoxyhypusine synthase
MKNVKKLKRIHSKIEKLRLKLIADIIELNTDEDNFDEVEDFLTNFAEQLLEHMLTKFEYLIAEIE